MLDSRLPNEEVHITFMQYITTFIHMMKFISRSNSGSAAVFLKGLDGDAALVNNAVSNQCNNYHGELVGIENPRISVDVYEIDERTIHLSQTAKQR